MHAIEPFTDRNGRPIQVGDMLEWETVDGRRVTAPVTGYAVEPSNPEGFQEVLHLRLPNGNPAHLFRHQTTPMVSHPAA